MSCLHFNDNKIYNWSNEIKKELYSKSLDKELIILVILKKILKI